MKNYTQSPYSKVLFSEMTADKLETAYAHFSCLLGIGLSKKHKIDFESLKQSCFTKLNIDTMNESMLNDFIKDCEGYLKYIKAVGQIKDTNMTERVNALSNIIEDVLPDEIKEKEFLSKVKDMQKNGLTSDTSTFDFDIEDDTDDFELSDDDYFEDEEMCM